jgi:hypothetical protein
MARTLRRLSAAAALAVPAGICAEFLAHRAFTRLVRKDVEALRAQASPGQAGVVTEEMLSGLPESVRRYLTYTGVVGKPFVSMVRLKQQGTMRPGPGRPWMPLDAEEHYCVTPPGFVWDGTMRLGLARVGRARDMYLGGTGHMLVKVASLIPVVDAKGEEMDQGSMMRYLSEMMFFPVAFLGGNISFQAVDHGSAQVTLSDHGRTATGTMYFDGEGKLTDFVAMRYRMVGGRPVLATWSTPVTAYGEFEGLKLPVAGKALWKLPDGDLEYVDVMITELHYDVGAADRWPPRRGREGPDENTGLRGE